MDHRGGLEPISAEAFSLLSQFYEYDRNVPLGAKTYDQEEHSAYIREKIVFRGGRDCRVPAYFAYPRSSPPPYPCILLLHGLGASKEDWWVEASDNERLMRGLIYDGFAMLALDLEYHGERTHNSDYQSAWSMIVEQGGVNMYREMLVQSALDHRRALDYLIMRPEIDKAPIGIFGRSVGGLVTYIVTAIDARIKTAVISSTLPLGDFYIKSVGWEQTAKQRLAPVAPRNFAPAITNTPLLMLNGTNDPYGTVEDIRYLHELVGSPTKELLFFDSGHLLPAEFISKTVAWFRKHLK